MALSLFYLKLSAYTGDARYMDAGEFALAPLQPALAQVPTEFAWRLCALDIVLTPPKEIAIVGDGAKSLLDLAFTQHFTG